ncbi:MAG: glycoside hydrolase family 31 protein [Eubacteriales bacterium]|nr:glycoside hydrolase family 31 protein [Eubacteriales bacterium]
MTQPETQDGQTVLREVKGDKYRFTVLTQRLIRMEYCPDGLFEDRPTQTVQCREFPAVPFHLFHSADGIELQTDCVTIFYNEKPFSAEGLWAENHSDCGGIFCTWHFGDSLNENLMGTARTLDEADGAVLLECGVQSRLQGYSLLDDSASMTLDALGWPEPRCPGIQDIYFFSYGYDYPGALRDFFRLCGAPPLLPRYALGNWWSRFKAYSAREYIELMEHFVQEQIPLSVAVLDMDWHITQPTSSGKGWTGYTWNRTLFPDPKAFLAALHQRRLKVTLNVHPAEGIQAHEEMYKQAAQELGRNAAEGQRIPFAPENPAFMKVYFSCLHHPREAEGVDFWWIDWQQGAVSRLKGLDPLWMLNHLHTHDSARQGMRPLILSRYAGPGSHRYPVGFSGDSVISWASLAFQPYFTATAANIGYGWWSHDIGGHTHGCRYDELQVRWLEFGVFSPILRLHSTCNHFNGKEPWRYPSPIREIMGRFLRLRHQLIPYLYTMNHRCHCLGETLISPMYYQHPREGAAYEVPNQYHFGTELIVCPITQPMDRDAVLGSVEAWLPSGQYMDFFTGLWYEGNRRLFLHRPLEAVPVLAKVGAIVPMNGDKPENGVALPKQLELLIFGGADGAFSLYEDDGETTAYLSGESCVTELVWKWREENTSRFFFRPAAKRKFMPQNRSCILCFIGVQEAQSCALISGGYTTTLPLTYDEARHKLTAVVDRCKEAFELVFDPPLDRAANDVNSYCMKMLNAAQIEYERKDAVWALLTSGRSAFSILSELPLVCPNPTLREAIAEALLAQPHAHPTNVR